jgi:hypothetical protein
VALPTTSSTRIKANNVLIQLNTTGTTWKDFSWDFISLKVASEDASNDQTTFLDASLGGAVDLYMEGELIQSTESSSLWQYLYANPGKELPFRYSPWGTGTSVGNANTTDKPGYTGTLRLPRIMAPGLGGAASVDGTFASDTVRFDIIGSLAVDTSASTWTRA